MHEQMHVHERCSRDYSFDVCFTRAAPAPAPEQAGHARPRTKERRAPRPPCSILRAHDGPSDWPERRPSTGGTASARRRRPVAVPLRRRATGGGTRDGDHPVPVGAALWSEPFRDAAGYRERRAPPLAGRCPPARERSAAGTGRRRRLPGVLHGPRRQPQPADGAPGDPAAADPAPAGEDFRERAVSFQTMAVIPASTSRPGRPRADGRSLSRGIRPPAGCRRRAGAGARSPVRRRTRRR